MKGGRTIIERRGTVYEVTLMIGNETNQQAVRISALMYDIMYDIIYDIMYDLML